ncbi:hypothetical protein F0562_008014 [Nyssa sinensis]|uniref:Uncharacterized protein n=1 Tax=Nyssa sinensis TaxID=561372 RepID=A0A5J5A7U7_9ASTE|nr:hypothetical protein F0562_008014 [Nyssa sinensis]
MDHLPVESCLKTCGLYKATIKGTADELDCVILMNMVRLSGTEKAFHKWEISYKSKSLAHAMFVSLNAHLLCIYTPEH